MERKKSPANLSKVLTAARTRPGSCGSTPVHRNRLSGSSGKCPVVQGPMLYNVGRGSLPRNPKGKMPLHGRVAGYRQQPVNQVNEYWLDQQFFQVHFQGFFFIQHYILQMHSFISAPHVSASRES